MIKRKINMNRKKIKKGLVAAAMAGVIAVSGSSMTAHADTKSVPWTVHKTPGTTGVPSTTCTLTYYAGTIKFYTYTLEGSSYVVGKCEGLNCTINNANKYVQRSKESTTDHTDFKVKPAAISNMKFIVSAPNNGGEGSTIHATGKLCY